MDKAAVFPRRRTEFGEHTGGNTANTPLGIDLSSAVEIDGKKDREKILQAVKTVRNFESSKYFSENKIIYK